VTPVEINEMGRRLVGCGWGGLRDFYFALCDKANATDNPSDTEEYRIAQVVRTCAEISHGEFAGIRIGMQADLRLPDNSDGFLGFSERRIPE
jgi:hypothetical protein